MGNVFVNVINLPQVLPGELDLEATNRSLLSGEVTLNWSQVEDAPQVHLAVLLAGLDLVEHSEVLGIETVPDSLSDVVLLTLSGSESQSPHRSERKRPVNNSVVPATWASEQQADLNGAAPVNKEEQLRTAQPIPLPPSSILQPLSPSALRHELERLVLQDLLGPAGGLEEEIDEGSVRDRYLVGALAPRDQQILPEELDELAIPEEGSGEDGSSDEAALQVATLCPSSIGMSFCVDDTATHLNVNARWGYYRREHSETLKTPKGAPKTVWKRQQMGGEPRIFSLKEGPLPSWSPEPEEQPDVVVRGVIRRSEGSWTVTLFLVNEQREPEKRRDEAWVFQPELVVAAPGGAAIFQQRPRVSRNRQSTEEQAMAMLYRRHVGFAIGHGVSTHAETVPGDPTRATRLSTCVVPRYDVPRTESPTGAEIPELADLVLDMKALAESPMADLARTLTPLVTAYEAWIASQASRINDLGTGLSAYRHVAVQALEECRRTSGRIREGITLLAHNEQAARAFAFMNRAMWQQRIHTLHAEERRRGQHTPLADKDRPENRSWRPFQLAFILLNLPALTDLHHPDRSVEASAVADLLWFPTGGGKTEAYLGLTAYTLAIRRLQGTIAGRSGEDGVAVIMRYTLRLLTLQQFQRASALICACEVIRQEDTQRTWGNTPFRLGLWVGQRTTPNTTEQSEESSRQDRGLYQRGSAIGGVGSPRQLTNCPWCGSPIDAGRDIKIETFAKGRGRTFIYCGDPLGRCAFSRRNASEGLPVLVVDEEIYRCLPSLLIATVDKFAQMPWNGATQMLFGQVDKKCSRHGFRSPDLEDKDQHRAVGMFPAARSVPQRPLRPPDLIIQDELHLISGPLGTLVGLYETVVDHLASWEVDGGEGDKKWVLPPPPFARRASRSSLFSRAGSTFSRRKASMSRTISFRANVSRDPTLQDAAI